MRTWLAGVLCLLTGCGASAQAQPMQTHIHVVTEASGGTAPPVVVTAQNWIGAAPAQGQLVANGDGQTYVGVWIDTPAAQPAARRAPMDLSLVIDNSGSMAGDKIANARAAAVSLLEGLNEGDIVSVYAFETQVREVAPPTVVSNQTRADLIQRVGMIEPMGSTNLFGGLQMGEARAMAAPPTHPIRRVVLISDGMANVGPSSPEELGNVAAQGTDAGVQVSAIGVGLQYDERTLGALVVRSAGRLYHLTEPSQMAAILRDEMQLLASTVAAEAYIEVTPAPGVELQGAELLPGQLENGRLRVRLGTLVGGQHRELLVRARVSTAPAADRPLATARLVFRDPGGAHAEHAQNVDLRYGVTADAAAAQRSADGRVAGMLASYQASQAQLHAAQLINQGQVQQAAQEMQVAEAQLRSVAASAAAPAPVRERLMRQAARIDAGRTSAVRAVTPAAQRASSLENNASAYSDMGL